jgi:hydroxypyruvate reductase
MIDRATLEPIAREAVASLDPEARVAAALADLDADRVTLLALGKATGPMIAGAERALGDRIIERAVAGLGEGSHPVPDAGSERAGRALLAAATAASGDRVVALVSGGGSALAAVPAPGLTLADKQAATRALLAGGAAIDEINAVRKHLSAIKGGQLAAASPVPVTSLILSDVVSGDLAAVASGPTLPDPTTRAEAAAVIARYRLDSRLAEHLIETPKRGREGDEHRCLADNQALVEAAAAAARRRGLGVEIVVGPLTGDVAAVADDLLEWPGTDLLVAGGEPTARLPDSPGHGGRMTHLALLLAQSLAGTGAAALAIGSDGVDGASGASGAAIDGDTWAAIAAAGIDGEAAIAGFDSATALAAAGALIDWGPTGANYADLILLSRAAR